MDDELLGAHLRAIRAAMIAVALALLATSASVASIGPVWILFVSASLGFVLYAVAPSAFKSGSDR